MSEFTSVSIIIPSLNETYLLRKTIEIIVETCEKSDIFEIIIVLCDRSTLECIKTAEQSKEDFSNYPIKIIYQKEPFIGNAYREAFELVKGSHIIMAAADMDMDPYAINQFIEKSKGSPDSLVIASRWISGGGFHDYGRMKYVLNYLSQKFLDLIFCTRMTDMTYGFRLYPAALMKSIRWEEVKHPFFLETCLKPLRLGVPFVEVPAVWHARTEGTSAISIFSYIPYIRTVLHIRLMKKKNIIKTAQQE